VVFQRCAAQFGTLFVILGACFGHFVS
jgi:hypothetical protein